MELSPVATAILAYLTRRYPDFVSPEDIEDTVRRYPPAPDIPGDAATVRKELATLAERGFLTEKRSFGGVSLARVTADGIGELRKAVVDEGG